MNKIYLFLLVALQTIITYSQKIPIQLQKGHIATQFKINHSIDAKVFLESGFSKLLIDKQFVDKHLKSNTNLTFTSENSSVTTWGSSKQIRSEGAVNGNLIINGNETSITGVIIDFSEHPAWKGFDMVFPIHDLKKPVCINYPEQYLTFEFPKEEELKRFYAMPVHFDENTKGLYTNCDLTIGNTNEKKQSLNGNFLFDLGAANPVYLNKNQNDVVEFLTRTQDFLLVDKNRISQNSVNDLAVLLPKTIQLENLTLTDGNIVAFRMPLTQNNQKFLGMIGNHFLEHSVVLFDFENQKIYFKPTSNNLKIVK